MALLQYLRIGLNGVEGVRSIANASLSAPERRLDVEAPAPLGLTVTTRQNSTDVGVGLAAEVVVAAAFPRAAAHIYRGESEGVLPGHVEGRTWACTLAAKPGRRRLPPRHRPAAASGSPAGRSAAAKKGLQVKRMRAGVVNGRDRGNHRSGPKAGVEGSLKRNQAPGRHDEGNKESVAISRSHERSNGGDSRADDRHKPTHLHPGSRSPANVSGPRPLPTALPSLTPGVELPSLPPQASASAGPLPRCLRFGDASEAVRQVHKTRFQPELGQVKFCVHPRAAHVFEWVFGEEVMQGDTRADWMIPALIQETVSVAATGRGIRKYHGLGQLERQETRPALPLGHDQLYAVMTISLLPDHRMRHKEIDGARVLLRNSFKLVNYAPLDGPNRLFLAYFLHRDVPSPGIRAGFMEVSADRAGFSVVDERSGFAFSSDRMDDFIDGLQRISGCRFRPDVDLPPLLHVQYHLSHPRSDDLNMFIGQAAARVEGAGNDRPLFDGQLRFFSPVPFLLVTPERRITGTLFRTCFMIVSDQIFYVDVQGRQGVVTLAESGEPGLPFVVRRHHGRAHRFIRDHGLVAGHRYAMDTIVAALENYAMTRLPSQSDPVEQGIPGGRWDNFHVHTGRFDRPRIATDSAPADETTRQPRSTYTFSRSTLEYVEHDTSAGRLLFKPVDYAQRRLVMNDENEFTSEQFARRNGIYPGVEYSVIEINTLLQGNGYVLVNANEDDGVNWVHNDQ